VRPPDDSAIRDRNSQHNSGMPPDPEKPSLAEVANTNALAGPHAAAHVHPASFGVITSAPHCIGASHA
jgi:hypothetical protein